MRHWLIYMTLPGLLIGSTSAAAQDDPAPAPLSAAEVETHVQRLAEGDWILRWQAMRLLADADAEQALAPLRRIVNDQRETPWLRGRALVAVAEIRDSAALGPALVLAKRDEIELRAAAIEALGIVGSPRGKDLVLEALSDRAPDQVRYKAVEAYARIHGEEALRFIEAGIASEDDEMARHAVRGLSHVDTPDARQKLIKLIEDDREVVAIEAAQAARRKVLPQAIGALLRVASGDGPKEPRQAARGALASYPPQVLTDPLGQAFRDGNNEERRVVIELLKARAAPKAVNLVAEVVRGGGVGEDVMVEALTLLGAEDAPRHQGVFKAALNHESPRVRQAAVAQLARTDSDLFVDLQPLLTDAEPAVRAQVLQELANSDLATPQQGVIAYLAPFFEVVEDDNADAMLTLVGNRIQPSEAQAAMAALGRFLTSSRHHKAAAEILGRVGDAAMRRQVAAAQGYITTWRMVGPFARDGDLKAAMDESLPPEEASQFDGQYDDGDETIAWQDMRLIAADGRVSPRDGMGDRTPRGIVYLGATLTVQQDTPITISFDSAGTARLFLNGEAVINHGSGKSTEHKTQLHAGVNRLLVKVAGDSWHWPVRLRITDEQGMPLGEALTVGPL